LHRRLFKIAKNSSEKIPKRKSVKLSSGGAPGDSANSDKQWKKTGYIRVDTYGDNGMHRLIVNYCARKGAKVSRKYETGYSTDTVALADGTRFCEYWEQDYKRGRESFQKSIIEPSFDDTDKQRTPGSIQRNPAASNDTSKQRTPGSPAPVGTSYNQLQGAMNCVDEKSFNKVRAGGCHDTRHEYKKRSLLSKYTDEEMDCFLRGNRVYVRNATKSHLE